MSDLLDRYRTLFAFNAWAHERQIGSLGIDAPGPAMRYISHTLAAEHNWLGRIQKNRGAAAPLPLELFPLFTGPECAEKAAALSGQWKALLNEITPNELEVELVYQNTQGKECRSLLKDVLDHVITHSMHHRAQAQSALRQAGRVPIDIGYIAYTRQANG